MSHDIVHTTRAFAAALAFTVTVFTGTAVAAPNGSGPKTIQPGAELSLRRQISIDEGTVRLGDIFDGRISATAGITADTVVAYAPQPGRRAIFDAEWLSRLAYRLQLNWRPTTRLDRVIVERTSTLVNGEHVRATIADELARRGYGDEFELELSNRNLLIHIDSKLPGTVGIASLSVDPTAERFNAVVTVPAGDPRAQRISVAGRMFAMIEVPVPVTTLRPGAPIQESDMKWVPVRARSVRDITVTDIADLLDMEPRRALRQDTPIQRSDIRRPQSVSKGNVVTMIYQTTSMSLSATGVAETGGTNGDIIRVRNRQTNLVIDARIIGPDRVAVQTLQQLAANQGVSR